MKHASRVAVATFAFAAIWGCGPAAAISISPGGGPFSLDALATPGTVYSSQQTFSSNATVNDDYTFTLSAAPLSTLTTAITLDLNGGSTGFGIANLVATWVNASNATLNSFTVTNASGDVVGSPFINTSFTSPGTYNLFLTGTALLLGGQYQMEIQSPSANGNSGTTPVPAALPLFATGMGLFGLLGWRKKRRKASTRFLPALS